jgi:hypothetical protein
MMDITDDRLCRMDAVFRHVIRSRHGKEFSTFQDCPWLDEQEMQYKRKAWREAMAALELARWESLILHPGEICKRVSCAMGRAGNLIPLKWGDRSFGGWTQTRPEDIPALEELTRQTMEDGQTTAQVADSFSALCDFLRARHYPCQWPPMAFLLFLLDKQRFFPVHAGKFQDLLDELGLPVSVYGRVTGAGLMALLELSWAIREHLEAHGCCPRDAIDVQSYMWVVACNLDREWKAPIARPDWSAQIRYRTRKSVWQQEIGLEGERYVYEHERRKLKRASRPDLAARVEMVSVSGSDWGYDIRSFEKDGTELHIEVKATTRSPLDGPIPVYLSAYERTQSEQDKAWRLYAVCLREAEKGIVFQGSAGQLAADMWQTSLWKLMITPTACAPGASAAE